MVAGQYFSGEGPCVQERPERGKRRIAFQQGFDGFLVVIQARRVNAWSTSSLSHASLYALSNLQPRVLFFHIRIARANETVRRSDHFRLFGSFGACREFKQQSAFLNGGTA
jgi:hypothetical protein